MENKVEKKTKALLKGICIYTTYKASSIDVDLKFLQNAKNILNGLLEQVHTQLQELQNASQRLIEVAIKNEPDILLKYALGLKEAATIMLSDNSSEKESLKIAIVKKLKSLDKQINSLSKKLEQKENIESASPNTNKRKDHQNEEESSAQFGNLISKDSNKQGHKKQQKNQEKENNVQQHFTVNTPN